MAKLYANENFSFKTVAFLRGMGHDVLTSHDAGRANQGISDDEVLAFAIDEKRAVLTVNRKDFKRLHALRPEHFGIVICTRNENWEDFAQKIDAAILPFGDDLAGELIRVYAGQKPF